MSATGDSGPSSSTIDEILRSGLDEELYTGAVAAIGDENGVDHLASVGFETLDEADPVTAETRFDVASLTKPVVTTTIALRLVERGRFDVDATLGEYVPRAGGTARGEIPVRTLLTHTSGLPPYKSFPFGWESREALLESLYDSPLSLLGEPDELFVYSDLNFVHLADALRRATGVSLRDLAQEHVFEPAGMTASTLGPVDSEATVAATRDRRWRERVLRGEIHDYIGAIMAGESGNAGLFSTAEDLARFARSILGAASDDEGALLAPATVDSLRRNVIDHLDRPHGLGWRLAHGGEPARAWSDAAFGHTGFTGTSLWIDPDRKQFAVLLTNHLLTADASGELAAFRRRFHSSAAASTDDS